MKEENELADIEKQMENAKAGMNAPFAREAELKEKEAQRNEVFGADAEEKIV